MTETYRTDAIRDSNLLYRLKSGINRDAYTEANADYTYLPMVMIEAYRQGYRLTKDAPATVPQVEYDKGFQAGVKAALAKVGELVK